MEGFHQANGVPSGNDGSSVQHSGTGTKLRTPTVLEALPYTPLSSIVPFTPGK